MELSFIAASIAGSKTASSKGLRIQGRSGGPPSACNASSSAPLIKINGTLAPNCVSHSATCNPFMPIMCRSSTIQSTCARWSRKSRIKSSPEAYSTAFIPAAQTSRRTADRTDVSSSTIATTGALVKLREMGLLQELTDALAALGYRRRLRAWSALLREALQGEGMQTVLPSPPFALTPPLIAHSFFSSHARDEP
jgi:hypothetical protein